MLPAAATPQEIAVLGAGMGGLAAACFLADAGHAVTLIEAFEAPRPLGSGLLLQPSGLSVLACLGLDTALLPHGARISRLYGRAAGGKITLLDVRYAALAPRLFGLGVTRTALFETLYAAAQARPIRLITGAPVTGATDLDPDGSGGFVETAAGRFGPFDLIVDASGANSPLRAQFGSVRRDWPYPFGALWGLVDLKDSRFAPDVLDQRYQAARHMIGVLPVGGNRAALFWSEPTATLGDWPRANLTAWRDTLRRLWPETEPLAAQITEHGHLTPARYRDVVLKTPIAGRLLFIGDAAHCTSPQLGQGANLALLDALVLSLCLSGARPLPEALAHYARAREGQQRFYQWASRWLTPFFQSNARLLPWLRYPFCALPCWFPPTQWIGAQVLAGVKTGMFSRIDPGAWAPAYRIAPRAYRRPQDSGAPGLALSFSALLAMEAGGESSDGFADSSGDTGGSGGDAGGGDGGGGGGD